MSTKKKGEMSNPTYDYEYEVKSNQEFTSIVTGGNCAKRLSGAR